MKTIVFRAFCLFFVAGLSGSCATVDQYESRAYDGNLNTQNAINQEVLVNIIRASQYQALIWNPTSSITGAQSESLATGLPTINIGPAQTAAQHIYSITNSVTSGVTVGYTTAPLATTAFQAGMLTPVDLKTVASLTTYYPRETIFYALIGVIDVKLVSSDHQYARLANDPSQAFYDVDDPFNLDQTKCKEMMQHRGLQLFFGARCSYARFVNLLSLLIDNGLYTELVQIPAPQPAQAQANQANVVTVGRFCFNKTLVPQELFIQSSSFPSCGLDKKQNAGGTIVTSRAESHKFNDVVINTDTKSETKAITTTTTSILPITGHTFKVKFKDIGWVEITFEMRSPNGFLSYLGSWYNVGDQLPFESYDTFPAKKILKGSSYLSILNGPPASCYSSVRYNGQTYCVPMQATHTSMLMDLAVILRNLNVSPTDLNAPISVRVAN